MSQNYIIIYTYIKNQKRHSECSGYIIINIVSENIDTQKQYWSSAEQKK